MKGFPFSAQQAREHQARHGFSKAVVPASVAPPEPGIDIEPPGAFTGSESEMHDDFATDMGRRGVHLIHARGDMRSTIEPGLPDFHCMYTGADDIPRGCAVEFKKAGGRCSKVQIEKIADMRRKRIPVIVAWTLKDAIDFMKTHLNLPTA